MGEWQKEMDKMRDRSVLFINSMLYSFNPWLSIVGDEFAARDTSSAAFWLTKPQLPGRAVTASWRPPRRNGTQ